MNIQTLTATDVASMSYNQLIGLVRETNRPPGGLSTVVEVASRAFLNPESRVLDIGCSTGFTSIELARLTKASVIGIDINPVSIATASERAIKAGAVSAEFQVADATALPFENGTFDLVFCGNVTSLIDDQAAALREYLRVLKPTGLLAAVPMYYVEPPPREIVQKVRAAIHVDIEVKFKREATGFFRTSNLELVHLSDWRFDRKTDGDIEAFCEKVLRDVRSRELSTQTYSALVEIYTQYMALFRENLSYMGYSVMLVRGNAFIDEGELFTGTRVS